MRKPGIILFVGILLFLFSACEIDRCFKKKGDIVEKRYDYDSIATISIEGIFNVELIQDTCYFIEAEAHEQVMRGVELEYSDNNLVCYNYNGCFWRRSFSSPTIRVHFSDIRGIEISEASYIFSTDTITDSFQLIGKSGIVEADITFNNKKVYCYNNKTCGGSYVFRGKTENAFLMCHNTAVYKMSDLECKEARVRNYSIINMEVNVTEKLNAEIYNTGNIIYKGTPTVIIDSLTSSGRPVPFQ